MGILPLSIHFLFSLEPLLGVGAVEMVGLADESFLLREEVELVVLAVLCIGGEAPSRKVEVRWS